MVLSKKECSGYVFTVEILNSELELAKMRKAPGNGAFPLEISVNPYFLSLITAAGCCYIHDKNHLEETSGMM